MLRDPPDAVWMERAPERVPVPLPTQRAVFARDGLCCRYCGWKSREARKFQIDHVIPVVRGGTNDKSNLVVCCRRCNREKGTAIWTPLSVREARALRRPVNRATLEP